MCSAVALGTAGLQAPPPREDRGLQIGCRSRTHVAKRARALVQHAPTLPACPLKSAHWAGRLSGKLRTEGKGQPHVLTRVSTGPPTLSRRP